MIVERPASAASSRSGSWFRASSAPFFRTLVMTNCTALYSGSPVTLQQVGHGRAVARERPQMVRRTGAGDPSVVLADIGGVRGHMGHARVLPEGHVPPPDILVARARRDPDLQPDVLRLAPGITGQRPQLGKRRQCLVAWGIGERHVSVAVFGDAVE